MITRLFLSILFLLMLVACSQQNPSEVGHTFGSSDSITSAEENPEPHQDKALINALGVDKPAPAKTAEGVVLLQVSATPPLYSDGGLVVPLNGSVTLPATNSAQLDRILWRQIAGPQAVILNPESAQAQILLPQVAERAVVELALSAADSEGRVAEARTRIHVLPLDVSSLANSMVHRGEGGQMEVTLSLHDPSERPVTLSYATQDGTAIAEEDYLPVQGRAILDAENPQVVIVVEVLSRETTQGDVYFQVQYTADHEDSQPAINQTLYVVLANPEPPTLEAGEPIEGLPFAVTYIADEGGSVHGETTQTLDANQEGTPVTAVAASGYRFVGWSDGVSTASRFDASIESNLQVTARFRKNQLWLATGHHGHLEVNSGPSTATVNWPAEPDKTYNLIITQDPEMELENYSAYGARMEVDVTPPFKITELDTDTPYYIALQAEDEVAAWSSFVPRVLGIDGRVNTIAVDEIGTRYVGGSFKSVGAEMGRNAVLPVYGSGSPHPLAGANVNGPVYAVAADGSGGWYIGGWFSQVNDQDRANLAHIDAAGRLTAWDPRTNSDVRVLVIEGDMIYAGGKFTQANGIARSHLAAFDREANLQPWAPEVNNLVATLAIERDVIYVGGGFSQAGTESRNRLAAFDREGQILSWNPGANGPVDSLVIDQGVIYVGGYFTEAGGEGRNYLAAFDPGGDLMSWNPDTSGRVMTLSIDKGVIYAGGTFVEAGGEARNRLAAFNHAGELLSWNPGESIGIVHTIVTCLAIDQDVVYVGGHFSRGDSRASLAAFNRDGELLYWDARVDSRVDALAIDQTAIFVGGTFSVIDRASRSNLAALDREGALLPWNPGTNGSVNTLAFGQQGIYAGGVFTVIAGKARNRLAAFDESGELLPWNPEVEGSVLDLIVDGDVIYAGGRFTQSSGEVRNNLAAFDQTGDLLPWNPGANDAVEALAIDQGVVYASGRFTHAGGEDRHRLAAFDGAGDLLTWSPDVRTGSVRALTADQGVIYIGGQFSRIGEEFRNGLAAFDRDGALLPWNPGARDPVCAIAGGRHGIYVSGLGQNGFGGTYGFLEGIDRQGELLFENPGTGNDPCTVVVDEDVIYVGGAFTQIGDERRGGLAAFDIDGNLLNK